MRDLRIRVTPNDAIDALIWTVLVGAVCWIAGWRDLSAGIVLVGTFLSAIAYVWVGGIVDCLNDQDIERPVQLERCAGCRALRPVEQLGRDGACVDGCDERQTA